MALLDPKLDVVFKLLFADPRNERLLVSLVESVLGSSIAAVSILEPELTEHLVEEKGVVVDLLAELSDGTRVNIEMQCDPRGAIRERWLYSWARLYSQRIKRGEVHANLAPVAVIVFLDAAPSKRFHQTFELLEVHDHTAYSRHLAIHLIELPQRSAASSAEESVRLLRWASFLADANEERLHLLAAEDAIMAEAKEALERLSADAAAQALAEARLKGLVHLQLRDQYARAEGRQEGREEGRAEGRDEGRAEELRDMILKLAQTLQIDIDAHRPELATAAVSRLRES